jgi:hypothetical protein
MTITNRTASLLMLFCAALFTTGVLLALAVSALDRPSPWLLPALAVVSQIAAFYVGRDALLPREMAAARLRAAGTLIIRVVVTLGLAVSIAWGGLWIAGRPDISNVLIVVIWFVLLRVAFRRRDDAAVRPHP